VLPEWFACHHSTVHARIPILRYSEPSLCTKNPSPSYFAESGNLEESFKFEGNFDSLKSMDPAVDFGQQLRRWIQRRQITQKEFAKQVGVSPGYLSDVIRNRRIPRAERWQDWIRVLGLDRHESQHFTRLGILVLLPDAIRPHMQGILDRLAYLEDLVSQGLVSLERVGKEPTRERHRKRDTP